ncbi:MAG: TldD/PmbA family protein [Acidimicrobiia bacterium]|nr:TldD/PmbA family protein [Acidimicrobiia bacterium]
MFDYAQAAVEGALAAGATYADARAMVVRQQGLSCRNQNLDGLDFDESAGVGVRALLGSSWGFYATPELTETAARAAGVQAAAIAAASGRAAGAPLQLLDVPVVTDYYETPHDEAPFDVPLSEKADLLVAATAVMQGVPGVDLAEASMRFWDTDKYFVSSQGHRISQHLVESGAEIAATAIGESETQRRSYPQSFGHFLTGGYEVIRGFDLIGNAGRVAEEAVALLTAPECPTGTLDLILESSQLALQIHESVGHATELDRILGWEAAFAGTSWLDLSKLGRLKFGSPLMNITADATLPGSLATFGYDDEGTSAQQVDIVKDGIWVGVLSGRDSAAIAGLPPGGMVRGDGYNRLPMVRMTNIGLLAGNASLDEIVSETKDGVYMATNRSWSIDDKRLNFQFGCQAGWEVKNGKLGRMVRNPTYTGISPEFWGSLDMLAGEDEMTYWGIPNCGKGQPVQSGHTGHPAAPARFRNVRVGVKG